MLLSDVPTYVHKPPCELEAHRLERVRNLFNMEIEDRIQHIRATHNRSLPIHNLPVELFVEILSAALDPIPTWGVKQTLKLTRVSRYWRSAVNRSQRFWPLIDCQTSQRQNVLVLDRCTTAPLSIKCELGEWEEDERERDEETARLEIFLAEASLESRRARWKSATFAWHSQGPLILPVLRLESSTPLLEEFSVFDYSDEEESGYPTIPQPKGAPLRRLSLWGAGLSTWAPWPFSRSEVLALDWLQHLAPSVEELHIILSSTPALRHLHLSYWLPKETAVSVMEATIKQTHPLRLPQLQSISIQDVPTPILQYLATIDPPACRSIQVSINTEEQIPPALGLCTPAILEARTTTVAYEGGARSPITIRSSRAPISVINWGEEVQHQPGFKITVPFGGSGIAWKGFQSILSRRERMGIMSIELGAASPSFPSYNPSPQISLHPMSSSNTIRYISILNHRHGGRLLEYLSIPQSNGSGTATWPFPSLLAVNVSGCRLHDLSTNMMIFAARRYSGSNTGDPPAPARLRVVQMREGPAWDAVKSFFENDGVQVLGADDVIDWESLV